MKIGISDETLERWVKILKAITEKNPEAWGCESKDTFALSFPKRKSTLHITKTVDHRGDGRIIISLSTEGKRDDGGTSGNRKRKLDEVKLNAQRVEKTHSSYESYLELYRHIEKITEEKLEMTRRKDLDDFIRQMDEAMTSIM